jgi:hypothetical protein
LKLKWRIERMEQRRSRRDGVSLSVKLARWLATAPWVVIERECCAHSGVLDLATLLRGLSPAELATALNAARTLLDGNVLARVRNAA